MTSLASGSAKNILIMAGGTGGHIFPGIAVAEYLRAQGWEVHWLGTADHMEAEIVPKHLIPIHFIEVSGLRGKGLLSKISAVIKLVTAIGSAWRLIRRLQPDVVLGMGGYASGAGGIAARMQGIPLLIHEQNAVLGLTNRWLAKIASRVLLGFAGAARGLPQSSATEVTGNPVRASIGQTTSAHAAGEGGALRILIIGGSLGARPFNQELPGLLASLHNIEVQHQTGKGNAAAVEQAYIEKHPVGTIRVCEFIEDMAAAYQWADLVICRAGAITVTEISLSGIAAIFIPLPHAVDDHQTANARSLVERRAGYLVNQVDMQTQLPQLLATIQEDPKQLDEVRLNALDCSIADATQRVAQICDQVSNSKRRKTIGGAVL